MAKKITQKEYETRINERFPHIVVYGDYEGYNELIWHYCLIHWRAFLASPNNMLNQKGKKGCLECSGYEKWTYKILIKELASILFPDGTQKFILLTTEKDFNRDFDGAYTIIRLRCTKDQYEWDVRINDVINNGTGCDRCSGHEEWTYQRLQVAISNLRFPDGSPICTLEMSESEFLEAYEKDGVNTKIPVRCAVNQDHCWSPSINNLINTKTGCPDCNTIGYSKAEIEWLEFVIETEGINIQHAKNGGQVKSCGRLVDGHCKETNTVFQFHGDFWHGNPDVHDPDDINPRNYKRMGDRYEETLIKDQELRDQGYNVIIMWESEWKEIKKQLKLKQKENK